ncbi:MAG: lytic transglycosylase domain-containing protein [Alphaproteobacteria bacterium]|nr:lytic transglycosylase domain-containing protein [Alphaproteobacteria bacterium]MCW5741947.1 lytic transglycosylase domain-containing protein [Alphaproteobacteria bacterium]
MKCIVALLGALAICVPFADALAQAAAKPAATKPPPPAKRAAAAAPAAKPVARPARPVARPAARPATRPAARPAGRPAWRPAARPRQAYVPPPPVIDIDPAASLPSDLPTILSSSDVERYQRIIAAQAGGNWAAADTEIKDLRDRTLLGYMLAQRYLSAGYRPTQDELASWLREYNDHPDAPGVYRLAASRGAAGLTPSSFVSTPRNGRTIAPDTHTLGGGRVQAETIRARLARMIEDRGFDAARRLLGASHGVLSAEEVARWQGEIANRQLQAGNVDQPVGEITDERPSATWAAGIAAFRKGSYGEAARLFEQVADAPSHRAYSAVISAGAFWAARANLLAGNPERFSLWMKRAAIYDRTFYGLLALKTLGVDLKPLWRPVELDRERRRLLLDSAAGRRGIALLQLRAVTNAETEFFAAAVDADPQIIEAVLAIAEKARLPALALRVANASRERPERIAGLDNALYPIPPYTPKEGFVVEPALVYGFMRQESAFNPRARSYVGAMGLMQLMPGTATAVVRQFLPDRAGTNPYDPSFNVSMGQQYIRSLLGGDGYSNDLIKVVAAYNAGPGNVNKWMAGDAAHDPLLFAASIPLNETRGFVEAVMSNYWLYQLRMGKPTPTLDELAQHQWPRYEGK